MIMENTKSVSDILRKYWITVLIAIQPLLDVLAFWTQSEKGTAAGYIRLAVLAAIAVYVLITRFHKKGIIAAFCLTALVFVCHVINGFRCGYSNLFADLKYIASVASLPVFAVCFCALDDDENTVSYALKGLLISAIIEAAVLIIAYFSGTYTFTYSVEKIGFSGWVIDSNRCCHSDIVSTICIFAVYFAYKAQKTVWKIIIPCVVFAALITNGTRACYLTLYALAAGFPVYLVLRSFICKESMNKGQRLFAIIMALLFAAAVAVYPVSPRKKMDDLKHASHTNNEQIFAEEMKELGYDIYSLTLDEKLNNPVVHDKLAEYYYKFIYSTVDSLGDNYSIDRIITALNGTVSAEYLGDTRNMKELNARFIFEDSDFLTKLTGFEIGRFSHDYEDLENDWYALFYYYGYIGMAVFVFAIAFVIYRIIRLLNYDLKAGINSLNFTLLLCFVMQLGLAYFSGAMLRRPNSSIYLSLAAALIIIRTRMPSEKEVIQAEA